MHSATVPQNSGSLGLLASPLQNSAGTTAKAQLAAATRETNGASATRIGLGTGIGSILQTATSGISSWAMGRFDSLAVDVANLVSNCDGMLTAKSSCKGSAYATHRRARHYPRAARHLAIWRWRTTMYIVQAALFVRLSFVLSSEGCMTQHVLTCKDDMVCHQRKTQLPRT